MANLTAERRRRQLTQTDVARAMGTTQPYVARLESGELDPRIGTFFRYVRAVGAENLLVVWLRPG